jgi:putative phosphoesterase
MKIAIISDIHDNLPNLEKFLNWAKAEKVEKIICCGDVTNSETIGLLSSGFLGEIYLVRGNADIYDEDELVAYPNIKYGGRKAVWEIAGRNIGVCHEPFLIKEVFAEDKRKKDDGPVVPSFAKKKDIIFYGHTHRPWLDDKGETVLINPGALSGGYTAATFAGWDTEKGWPELKILDLFK